MWGDSNNSIQYLFPYIKIQTSRKNYVFGLSNWDKVILLLIIKFKTKPDERVEIEGKDTVFNKFLKYP